MSQSILVVDDDTSVRRMLKDALGAQGYTVAEAADGATAVSVVGAWRPEVVLLDVNMPGMDGLTALNRILEAVPNTAAVMISSVDEIDTVRKALKTGAYDYLLKPLDIPVVIETISRAAEKRALKIELEQYRRDLETLVFERTQELESALERIESTYTQTILALGSALEMRDVETQAHSLRVARYTISLCRQLGIEDPGRLRAIERGAYLHDIGKIGVPDQILRKPGPLSKDEWAIMKQHPVIGTTLLRRIEFLASALTIVRSHHERWDGKGYPDGLIARDIPQEARAFAVADALDAITTDRPYREAQPILEARRIIATASGSHFDPDAVAALKETSDQEIEEIQASVGTGDSPAGL